MIWRFGGMWGKSLGRIWGGELAMYHGVIPAQAGIHAEGYP
jgi:hypothetical protein